MSNLTSNQKKSAIGLIALAFIAFISLGLPDGLLGVAFPSIRNEFSLPLDSLGILLFSATFGYLTAAFFSGRIMAKLGVGGLLSASCFLTGAGLLGYTLAPAWWVIVLLGCVAGLGAGAIDAGLNTYIAAHHGERLMQWLHASFGVGITLGPIIMTAGLNLLGKWRTGYIVVGCAQLLLALCFLLTMKLWKNGQTKPSETPKLTDYKTPLLETLRKPAAWLSISLFFIYVGIELGLGHWAYTLLTESRQVAPDVAGFVTGSYWATFTLGRILAGVFAKKISTSKLLSFAIATALAGALMIAINAGPILSVAGVALMGFAVAPIFPGLVSGTSKRVGAKHAANTIGMQMSAAGLGGASLPALAGVLARQFSLEAIPVFLVILIALLLTLYLVSLKKKPVATAEAGSVIEPTG